MAFARDVYTASAAQTDFTISFSYLDETDVLVYEDGTLKTVTTDYTLPNATTVRFNSGLTGGEIIVIQRSTSQTTRLVNYTAGALAEADLDNDSLQAFYMAQESIDIANTALGKGTDELWTAASIRITNVADPTAAQDAATKTWVETAITNAELGSLPTPLSIANGGTAGATEGAANASLWVTGTSQAAGSSVTVPTDGNYFVVSGGTTINSFVVSAGRFFMMSRSSTGAVAHSASLALPGAANITMTSGDVMLFYATAANTVKCIAFYDASSLPTSLATVISTDNAWTGNQYFTPMSDSSSAGAITVDFTDGNYAEVTLTENITSITLTSLQAGGVYKIRFKQAAGSAYTITGWPSSVVWTNGDTDPVMNTTLSSYTMVTIEAGNTEHMGSSQNFK